MTDRIVQVTPNEVPHSLIVRAFSGTSMSPERRADRVVAEIVEKFDMMDRTFQRWVTDENRAAMQLDLNWFKGEYLRLYRAYWHSHSSVMSPMITGPAKFPTARNEKRWRAADNKLAALTIFDKTWLSRFESKYNPNSWANYVIHTGEAGSVERMKEKIERLEHLQETMKMVNKIVRSKAKKATDEWKRQALAEAGFSDKQVRVLMTPHRLSVPAGYEGWELSNNNANIRRCKERLVELEAAQARMDAADEDGIAGVDEYGDIEVVQNAEANRVQILFPGKPDETARTLLKRNGFRWSPRYTAWQRKLTDNGIAAARQVASAIHDMNVEYA